jgi:HEAT repeat protein
MSIDKPKNESIEHLIQLLGSKDLNTCLEAAGELGKLGHDAVGPVVNALRRPETGFGATQALASIGEPAVAPLIGLLKDPAVDAFAAEALRKIGASAVPALIETLSSADDGLRSWATVVLGWIADRRAVNPLEAALHDENDEVRKAAAKALSEIKTQQ